MSHHIEHNHHNHEKNHHEDMHMHPMAFHFGSKEIILFTFWDIKSTIGRFFY